MFHYIASTPTQQGETQWNALTLSFSRSDVLVQVQLGSKNFPLCRVDKSICIAISIALIFNNKSRLFSRYNFKTFKVRCSCSKVIDLRRMFFDFINTYTNVLYSAETLYIYTYILIYLFIHAYIFMLHFLYIIFHSIVCLKRSHKIFWWKIKRAALKRWNWQKKNHTELIHRKWL